MAVAKGRAFLLYLGGSTATVTGSAVIANPTSNGWTLVAGAQERSMTLTNEAIDGTTAPAALPTPLWQTQLAGAKGVAIECAFRYTNSAEERAVLDAAWSEQSVVKALLVYPPDDSPVGAPVAAATDIFGSQIFGEFLITSLSSTGGLSDTFNGSMSLVSTGSVVLAHGAS